MKNRTLIVTGGAGFIGSALVRHLIDDSDLTVVNVDKLTYAGNLESLFDVQKSERYRLETVDICDERGIQTIFSKYQPDGVLHLAAESHVDRSIDQAAPFINTNVVGTFVLLDQATRYWSNLSDQQKERFRFLHVSTDEVFGSLGQVGKFCETTSYAPTSPYSASKASSDHLVRAWFHTHGLPTLVTNCSNNYGPCQFPEKLIPLMIINALSEKPLPVYGAGQNVRDWLYVDDHVQALMTVFRNGQVGSTYNIGGNAEKSNLYVVETICGVLDEIAARAGSKPYRDLIAFVKDRPGHDFRYAVDSSKITRELGWQPRHTFETGIRDTIGWYLANRRWWQRILDGKYRLERLGLSARHAQSPVVSSGDGSAAAHKEHHPELAGAILDGS